MKTLFLLLTAGKLGKILLSCGSMILSVFAYSLVLGWKYAVGFVALLFLHETGHYIAARQKGLNVGLPVFIPFVGAWIELKEILLDPEIEAYVAFAGPFLGTLGALGCYVLARNTDSTLLLALAYAGFFLNLFNLIPLYPFDGGRITAIVSPKIWLLGAVILVGLFFVRPSPILVLMAILAVPGAIKAWKHKPADEEEPSHRNIDSARKIMYATFYLGLIVYLSLMTHNLHEMLTALRA